MAVRLVFGELMEWQPIWQTLCYISIFGVDGSGEFYNQKRSLEFLVSNMKAIPIRGRMLLHEELLNTNEYHGKRPVTDLNQFIVIGDKVELLDDMCGFHIISTGGKRKIFFDVEVNIYRLLEILPPLEFQKDAGNWMRVRRYRNTHSEPPLRASTKEEIIPKRAEYLDEGNERYSWKLAAAVQAWLEAPKYLKDNTPKKAIEAAMDAWQEKDSCHFKGKFAQHSKSKIIEVANWAYAGGRPKGSRNKKGKT